MSSPVYDKPGRYVEWSVQAKNGPLQKQGTCRIEIERVTEDHVFFTSINTALDPTHARPQRARDSRTKPRDLLILTPDEIGSSDINRGDLRLCYDGKDVIDTPLGKLECERYRHRDETLWFERRSGVLVKAIGIVDRGEYTGWEITDLILRTNMIQP